MKGNFLIEMKNDVDILLVVRDINLDNMGFLCNVEVSNGYDNRMNSKLKSGEEIYNKKRKIGDKKVIFIFKRRRLLLVRSFFKYFFLVSVSKVRRKVSLRSFFM